MANFYFDKQTLKKALKSIFEKDSPSIVPKKKKSTSIQNIIKYFCDTNSESTGRGNKSLQWNILKNAKR